MVGSATVSASAASPSPASAVLVVLSLRGGADGMSLVVPHGDPGYYTARPDHRHPAGPAARAPTRLFGLHPKLRAAAADMWNAGQLAAVHATGLTTANRSHFSAMEEVEEAHPGSSKRIGWLNRLVGHVAAHHNPLQGVGHRGGTPPTELSGPIPLMTIGSLDGRHRSPPTTPATPTRPASAAARCTPCGTTTTARWAAAVRSTMQATDGPRAGQERRRQLRRSYGELRRSARRWPRRHGSSAATSASR